MNRVLAAALAFALTAPTRVDAAPSALGSSAAVAGSAASPRGEAPAAGELCREHLPPDKVRPRLVESFPARGLAGHVAVLRVELETGAGEEVLPDGFHLENSGEQLSALEAAGFTIPDAHGGAGPVVERTVAGGRAVTRVAISLVPLPPRAGRHELSLPALPLAIARASGDLMTVCTSPHRITIDDPTASADAPPPRPNPPPRRQLEEWTWLKHAFITAAVALPLGLLLGWLAMRWWRRPRPTPPAPPPRPPWEVALEALDEVRHAGLLDAARFAEHFDRVSHVLRQYVGDRFGFDGLENTTFETMAALDGISPPVASRDAIARLLRHADLVKFAKLEPERSECEETLAAVERVVVETRPNPTTEAPRRPPASGRPARGERRRAGAEGQRARRPAPVDRRPP